MVLLHGFGASGEDLVGLGGALGVPAGTRMVFPAAPIALEMFPGADSRAWWMIDMQRLQRAMERGEQRDMSREVPRGLAEAREGMDGLLADIERDLAPSAIVLGGFSQGAMLATDVALHTSRRLAGLVLLSGTLIAEEQWLPLLPARKGILVYQSHGVRDPVLPFSLAERLRDEMVTAQLDVTWQAFRGAHEIPQLVVDSLGAFLARALR